MVNQQQESHITAEEQQELSGLKQKVDNGTASESDKVRLGELDPKYKQEVAKQQEAAAAKDEKKKG